MAKFSIEHVSAKNADDTYAAVKKFLSKENEINKLDADAKCTFDDANKSVSVKGSKFKAEMKVAAQGKSSSVQISVDLPMLLMPFKGKIQETLQKIFAKHLA